MSVEAWTKHAPPVTTEQALGLAHEIELDRPGFTDDYRADVARTLARYLVSMRGVLRAAHRVVGTRRRDFRRDSPANIRALGELDDAMHAAEQAHVRPWGFDAIAAEAEAKRLEALPPSPAMVALHDELHAESEGGPA